MKNNKKITLNNRHLILKEIAKNIGSFPKIQREIGKVIMDNPSRIVKMSITKLAQEAGAKSEASIVRFYRRLGFDSFFDFKISLAAETAGKVFHHIHEDIKIDDDVETIKNKIFAGSIKILETNMYSIESETLERAIELIEKSRRIIIIGFGASAAIAMYVHFEFSLLGFNCHFSPDSHLSSILTAGLDKNDLIFAVSYSGESKDVVVQAGRAKPLAKVIAITGFYDSSLAKVSDVYITTTGEEMNFRTDAMVARIVQLAVIDTLFTSLVIRRGKEGLEGLLRARHSLSYLKY